MLLLAWHRFGLGLIAVGVEGYLAEDQLVIQRDNEKHGEVCKNILSSIVMLRTSLLRRLC